MIDKLGWKIKEEKEKINIVTGAGISMSTGLPGGQELNENILQLISDPWCKVDSYKSIASSIPLETIFQALADYNLEEVIQEVIQNLDSPNITCTHQAINYFAQNNQIENIITFNFDRIHEKSFKKFENIVSENFGKTVIKRYKNEKGTLLNLIKLHGTCEQEGIITFSEYVAFPFLGRLHF